MPPAPQTKERDSVPPEKQAEAPESRREDLPSGTRIGRYRIEATVGP